jgi:hypothetical protein
MEYVRCYYHLPLHISGLSFFVAGSGKSIMWFVVSQSTTIYTDDIGQFCSNRRNQETV